MKYDDFVCCLKAKVQQHLGEKVRVDLRRVTKNNGVEMDGLSIIEENKKISPMIYIGDYYHSYEEGISFPEIVEKVAELYEETKIHMPLDSSFFMDFSKVRDRIICKLVNYEKNRELLKKVPHVPCLDLAVVFCCMMESEGLGNGMILIYNSHLEMWKVTKETVYERARKNTPSLLPYEFQGMGELLQETLEAESGEDFDQEEGGIPMYVLSNTRKYLGAANILYDNILCTIGERLGDDFFVLPSSVHEVIIVPASVHVIKEELENMVKEINGTQVLPEEILSDHVYFYEREIHRLSL